MHLNVHNYVASTVKNDEPCCFTLSRENQERPPYMQLMNKNSTATQKTGKACKPALQYTLANRSSSSCTIAKAYNTKHSTLIFL
jgi:hypothetical protein